jgi:plastocyanin
MADIRHDASDPVIFPAHPGARPSEGSGVVKAATDAGPRGSLASKAPWIAILILFDVLAVAGPVKMIAKSGDDGGGGGVVKMAGLTFAPDSLVVARGTTVLFDNNDVAPHTVTAQDGSVDSGTLRPGATFSLVVNDRFEYFCAIHPQMEASIEIEG